MVTIHESASRGSSFDPLVIVAVSRRFLLCFQVCLSCAQEGCLILSYIISAGLGNTLSTGVVRMHNKARYGSSFEDSAFFSVIFTVFTVRSINPFGFG